MYADSSGLSLLDSLFINSLRSNVIILCTEDRKKDQDLRVSVSFIEKKKRRRKKAEELRRVMRSGGEPWGGGQLQCGRVCRVSRERER